MGRRSGGHGLVVSWVRKVLENDDDQVSGLGELMEGVPVLHRELQERDRLARENDEFNV